MKKKSRKRKSNLERSVKTRAKLLDAAEWCLIRLGYAKTSNLEVCRRARLSNGALLHQFHTRENLLASTLERLYERQEQRVIREVEALSPGPERLDHLLDLMWSVFDSDDFKVILELWLAATNDKALRARVFPVMRDFADSLEPTAAILLFGASTEPARFRSNVGILMYMFQGMGLARATFGPLAEVESQRLRSSMKEVFRFVFQNAQTAGKPTENRRT